MTNPRYGVGDVVHLKDFYYTSAGWVRQPYIIVGIISNLMTFFYIVLDPESGYCYIDEGTIDKRRKQI